MNAAGVVSPDVAKEAQHARDWGAIQLQFGMKPNDAARMLGFKAELTRAQVGGNYSFARIASFIPESERKLGVLFFSSNAVDAADHGCRPERPR